MFAPQGLRGFLSLALRSNTKRVEFDYARVLVMYGASDRFDHSK